MATSETYSRSLIINISRHDDEAPRSSLEHLEAIVSSTLNKPQEFGNIEQLKVIGAWIARDNDAPLDANLSRARSVSRVSESDTHLTSSDSSQERDEFDIQTEREWIRGIKTMKKLIGSLPNLNTLE